MYYDPSGHSIKSWFENLCKKVAEFFGDDTPGNQAVNGNGLNSINNLDDLLPNPDYLSGISGNELYDVTRHFIADEKSILFSTV